MPGTSAPRRATVADAEALAGFLRRAYAGRLEAGYNFTAATMTGEMMRGRVVSKEVWVFEEDGGTVGTATIDPDSGVIQNLAVEPTRARAGLGARMLSFAEDRLRARGFFEARLDTPETLTELTRYYARRGYRRIGTVQWAGKQYRSVIFAKSLCSSP